MRGLQSHHAQGSLGPWRGFGCACVQASRRLALEWQAWVVRTAALRKAFVSVKGFYFQAECAGQPVTWLVPHALSQVGG